MGMLNTTIFVTLAGSHAHGTSGPHSDIDLRGVCIAPLPVRLSLYRRFEQFEGTLDGSLWDQVRPQLQAHDTAQGSLDGKVETVIYDVAKFLELCARANPNALEILFAAKSEWVFSSEPWDQLYRERHRFLTKKLEATYVGYALGQLKKIRLHREWVITPPKAPPTRAEYGLPETSTMRPPLEAERRYHAAQQHWESYKAWQRQRNPVRAELDRRYGYDTKHAAHLLRLLETGLEVIETGELRVRRDNAAELVAVINGALTCEQVVERAAELQAQMRAAMQRCTLPDDVDYAFVDDLLVSLVAP